MPAKLTWDETGKRLFETGVDQVVLYPFDSALGTYPTGVAWNGVTGITESPSGAEANPFYADNIKYMNLISPEEFGATLEAYTYPDEFAECDGSAEAETGVILGQQARKQFALCYRTRLGNDTDGDSYGYKLHIIYGCMAAPSEKAYATVSDSPEGITFSWEITTTPVPVTGYKPVSSIVINSKTATNLAALETILYGSGTAAARLPLPAEVLTVMGAGG